MRRKTILRGNHGKKDNPARESWEERQSCEGIMGRKTILGVGGGGDSWKESTEGGGGGGHGQLDNPQHNNYISSKLVLAAASLFPSVAGESYKIRANKICL